METRSGWLTRANGVTFLRLGLAPPLVISILAEEWGPAALIFTLAVTTDLADGHIARRYGESTPLGGLVDHAVDATFVAAGTGALAIAGLMPAPLPPLIVLAFLQYAFDSRAGAQRPLRGSSLGRWNGIAYYAILAVPIARGAFELAWPSPIVVRLAAWLLVVSTLLSILDRFRVSAEKPR